MTDYIQLHNTTIFSRVHFIMVSPSHPGNVGSAARAIKTMGFNQLHLVKPNNPNILQHPDAHALASGAQDILNNTQIHTDLANAIKDCTMVFGLTARPRALSTEPCDIRVAANLAKNELQHINAQIAFVLGTERFGLSNQELDLCQYTCHIPANPEYSSLNVSQALQLAAWEMRYALMVLTGDELIPNTGGQLDPGNEPADNGKIGAMLEHLEQAMIAVKFLDPKHPKKLIPRIQHMFNRNHLTIDEVAILRGLCSAMIHTAQKQD